MSDALFRHRETIHFRHCDPAGIVYYPNFLDIAEGAIEEWMRRALGENYGDWIRVERRALPRVKLVCDFAKPCLMGEELELVFRLAKIGRSSIELAIDGRVTGEPRFRIVIVLVNMSLDSHRAVPFADGLRAKLERYRTLSAQQE